MSQLEPYVDLRANPGRIPQVWPLFSGGGNKRADVSVMRSGKRPTTFGLLREAAATKKKQQQSQAKRWESVDLDRGQVTVEAAYAKNGETRTIDLNSDAWEALNRLHAGSAKTGLVFSNKNGGAIQEHQDSLYNSVSEC